MRGRQPGFKESEETREKKRRSMLTRLRDRKNPRVEWASREGWKPWGDRLNFLSPENQHLQTGRLAILPAKPKKRGED